MNLAQIIQLLIVGSIMLSVLSLALRAHPRDIFYLVRHWQLGLRAFLALFVIVPAVAIAVALIVDPPPAVKIAIIALAFSPTPPVLPKSQLKVGGSADYVTSLLIFGAIGSLVVAPTGILLAGQFFPANPRIGIETTAPILLLTVGAPLLLGFAGRAVLGERVLRPAKVIGAIGGITLGLGIVALLVMLAPAIWDVIGHGTLLALLIMIAAGVAAGYLLEGPAGGDRDSLALAAATRHPGVATAIAAATFPDEKLATAAIWLSMVLSTVLAAPLIKRIHRAADPPA